MTLRANVSQSNCLQQFPHSGQQKTKTRNLLFALWWCQSRKGHHSSKSGGVTKHCWLAFACFRWKCNRVQQFAPAKRLRVNSEHSRECEVNCRQGRKLFKGANEK